MQLANILTMLNVAQLANILRATGYLGDDAEIVGTECTFLREEKGLAGARMFSYRTKFFDDNEGLWCYGGVVLMLTADNDVTADYTGTAVPIMAVGQTR